MASSNRAEGFALGVLATSAVLAAAYYLSSVIENRRKKRGYHGWSGSIHAQAHYCPPSCSIYYTSCTLRGATGTSHTMYQSVTMPTMHSCSARRCFPIVILWPRIKR